jgi:hypothetical protein
MRRLRGVAVGGLFTQSLHLATKLGLVKMGRVALDGTKLEASASKHRAMSSGRLVDKEEWIEAGIAQLEAEAQGLLADAEGTDEAEDEAFGADGKEVDLPAEPDRREKRLAKLQAARAQIEAEAAEKARAHAEAKKRLGQERAGTSDERSVTDVGEAAASKARPKPKAQANFTDPDSRIMKNSAGAYIQAYNAKAVVDEEHQVITAADVTCNPSDALNYITMLDQSAQNTGPHPEQVLVDAGYGSETNLEAALPERMSSGKVTTTSDAADSSPEVPPSAGAGLLVRDAVQVQDLAESAPLVAAELGERTQQLAAGPAADDVVLVHRGVEHPPEDQGGVAHAQGGVRTALQNHMGGGHSGRTHTPAGLALDACCVEFADRPRKVDGGGVDQMQQWFG